MCLTFNIAGRASHAWVSTALVMDRLRTLLLYFFTIASKEIKSASTSCWEASKLWFLNSPEVPPHVQFSVAFLFPSVNACSSLTICRTRLIREII